MLLRFDKYNLLNILTLFSFLIYSAVFIRYHYDGHHIGLQYSNALDLLNGKKPYKEIFIQYGILTTFIHSFILKIFFNKIFFINFFNIIFYLSSVIFISLTIYNFTKKQSYAFLATILILFNHPIPWLPWSNYLSFFFISIGLFLISNQNKNIFFIGLFLSLAILSRQDFAIGILSAGFISLIFNFFSKDNLSYKSLFYLSSGFLIPIIIFFLYLSYLDVFEFWKSYLIISKFYIEEYETSFSNLIWNYIQFFSLKSFFNFIITPQYFLISIILITNSCILILKVLDKVKIKSGLFFIILLSSFLSSVSLKVELFRLYTSVIFGLIPLLYLISNIKLLELRKNFILIILLPSVFSFIFYPNGNNPSFNKIDFKNSVIINEPQKFTYNLWPRKKVETINDINNIINTCNVEYLENLTFDTLYSTIGNLNRIRLLPYEKSSSRNSKLHYYYDKLKNNDFNFIKKINNELMNNNIILLINNNNYQYNYGSLEFPNTYKVIEINESSTLGKPNILRIHYPSKCKRNG